MNLFRRMAVFFIVFSVLSSCGYELFPKKEENLIKLLQEGNCTRAQEVFLDQVKDMSKQGQRNNYFKFITFLYNNHKCDNVIIDLATGSLPLFDKKPDQAAFLYFYMAHAWKKKKEYDKASSDYLMAVKTIPKEASGSDVILLNAAWFMATCPDAKYRNGDEALTYSKQLMQQYGDEKLDYWSVLAAAYAEKGDFGEAIKIQDKAISILTEQYENKKNELKTASTKENNSEKTKKTIENTNKILNETYEAQKKIYQKYLDSYKSGKAWREE